MATHEFEPTPNELTPLTRFYGDLRYKGDSYIDLLIAAERLLEVEVGYEGERDRDSRYIPTAEQYEADPRIASEQFMLLPIKYIAPRFDNGSIEIADLKKWYEEMTGFIMDRTSKFHTQACLDHGTISSVASCPMSEECPLTYLSDYLQKGVRSRDFKQVEYVVEPERTYRVDILKMEVAKNCTPDLVNQINILILQYKVEFIDWFGALPKDL